MKEIPSLLQISIYENTLIASSLHLNVGTSAPGILYYRYLWNILESWAEICLTLLKKKKVEGNKISVIAGPPTARYVFFQEKAMGWAHAPCVKVQHINVNEETECHQRPWERKKWKYATLVCPFTMKPDRVWVECWGKGHRGPDGFYTVTDQVES